MGKRLQDLIYVTEERFGLKDYRKPIVWFDKLLVVGGILAGIAGRLLAGVWALELVVGGRDGAAPQMLAAGVLLWAAGEYFCRTGHRGLIYHHMDMLADYLDRRMRGQTNPPTA
jgi:hypothetical protein